MSPCMGEKKTKKQAASFLLWEAKVGSILGRRPSLPCKICSCSKSVSSRARSGQERPFGGGNQRGGPGAEPETILVPAREQAERAPHGNRGDKNNNLAYHNSLVNDKVFDTIF